MNSVIKKEQIHQTDKSIILKKHKELIKLNLKSITMITCDGYISTLSFLDNRKPISVSKLLKEFEKELTPYGFFRISKNTLVNINHIYSFNNNSQRLVCMVNNHNAKVSLRKVPQLKKLLIEHKAFI